MIEEVGAPCRTELLEYDTSMKAPRGTFDLAKVSPNRLSFPQGHELSPYGMAT